MTTSRPDVRADVTREARAPRPGIGVVGCGEIVRMAHLPAYGALGVKVVGVYDPRPEATAGVREEFAVQHVFASLDELMATPAVGVVDIATHADVRPPLIRRAIAAGKHVLSQKPLALDVKTARELVFEAEQAGVKLAVNHNGRWAPPWRAATHLVEQRAIGEVTSITHLDDRDFEFIVGTPYDDVPQFMLGDYSIHWIDITRCWLDQPPLAARAMTYRTPNQPPTAKEDWGGWISFEYENGVNALIRQTGCSKTADPGQLFWIHGDRGTIRGRIGDAGFGGEDELTVETADGTAAQPLRGRWFNDGFAGTMAELLSAISEDREPYHSGRHHLLSLEMTLAACRSAQEDGRRVALEEVAG